MSVLTDKIDALSTIPDEWAEKIVKFQPSLLNRLNRLASGLTTTAEGFIELTSENLVRIDQIMEGLKQYMTTGEYRAIVKDLDTGFIAQEARTIAYFESSFGSAPVTSFGSTLYNVRRAQMVDTVIADGLSAMLYTPVRDTLLDGVASGASYTDLFTNLERLAVGNDDLEGVLLRYSRQLVSDTLATTDRQFTQIVSDELGLEWFQWLGGRMDTTRCICNKNNGKYFHKKEIEALGEGDKKMVGECWDKKYIWQGRYRGTNAENIFSWVGGYNCQHSLLPKSDFDVPKKDIVRAVESGYYKPDAAAREHFGL